MDEERQGLLINKKIWLTKEGEKIKISKMSNQHLANTLRFLKRKCIGSSYDLFCFPSPQGEMAMMAWEQECDSLFETEFEVHEGVRVLLREAKRRKLDWETYDETMEYFQCRSRAITSTGRRRSLSGTQLKSLLARVLMNLLRS